MTENQIKSFVTLALTPKNARAFYRSLPEGTVFTQSECEWCFIHRMLVYYTGLKVSVLFRTVDAKEYGSDSLPVTIRLPEWASAISSLAVEGDGDDILRDLRASDSPNKKAISVFEREVQIAD
jgi:hypothetical protein